MQCALENKGKELITLAARENPEIPATYPKVTESRDSDDSHT